MRLPVFLLLLAGSQAGIATDVLNVCIDYHCEQQLPVTIEDQDRQLLLQSFTRPAGNAADERNRIRQAIALFEQVIGSRSPTYKDLPKNSGEDELGQLDCIAESTNTLTYLQWLEHKGRIKWHSTGSRIKRAPGFFDVHWAVEIKELGSGNRYIVDSWYGGNGDLPAVQTLDDWLNKVPPGN